MTLLELPAADVTDQAITTARMLIPGWGALEFIRNRPTGALLAIEAGGRRYLTVTDDGQWRWQGICTAREELIDDGMQRTVTTSGAQWIERYRWSDNKLTEVDGVIVRRDCEDRVIACLPDVDDNTIQSHRWFYSYNEQGIAHIATPATQRWVATRADGRAISMDEADVTTDLTYDDAGRLIGSHRPLHDHIDEAGRCWATVNVSTGNVRSVFIWDGTRCLARIDGPIKSPVAAVFSLDPSATPVRIITASSVTRVPRDAYGEGLLGHRGVPGLYGGQIAYGLVHLPLRRLNPKTASFCEPDPLDGGDNDPRRTSNYHGPLPTELDPRSTYEVCRCDPVGRADPTGGVSAGLIISDLTWSFQNNLLSFFGIDWWFNLFGSLIVAPFKGIGNGIEYDFFSSSGLSGSEGHGAFGLRRGGIINAITGGRAFATQHIIWAPDREFAALEQGEVIEPDGQFLPTHCGTILSATPDNHPPVLLASMNFGFAGWATNTGLNLWTRHGGLGISVAPGVMTPWFPNGGLHLDTSLTTTRGDVSCAVEELQPTAVGEADLEDRSFLTAPVATTLNAGDSILIDDGTNLETSNVLALVPLGGAQRIQLDSELTTLGSSGLRITQITVPATSESLAAGSVTDSLDAVGSSESYAANDLLRLTDSASPAVITIVRIARLEARLPLERPLPSAFGGPITITLGSLAAATTVTVNSANLDFGSTTRPAVGTSGLVSGGGTDFAVRVESHAGSNEITIDDPLPATIIGAPAISYRTVTAGTALGTRLDSAETNPELTYTPTVAGMAPDGSAGTVVVHCLAAGVNHARLVPAAPVHDVLVVDRTIAGSGPFAIERLAATGPTTSDVTRLEVMALVVAGPERFSAAAAVYLTKVQGEPATPAASVLNGDVVNGVLTSPVVTPVPGIDVGRPMLAGARAVAIQRIQLTVEFDRSYDLASAGLSLVQLATTGYTYLSEVTAPNVVAVRPEIQIGAAVEVPFPRFEVNDLVWVTTPGGDTWHRVLAVSGGQLTLVDGPALNTGDPVSTRHVVSANPIHGGPFLAINGTRTGGGTTNQATFSVWSSNALTVGTAVGIVNGPITHPTQIAGGGQTIEITFSELFNASGVNISAVNNVLTTATPPTPIDRFVPRVALDGGVLLLEGTPGDLETAPGESLLVVAYEPAGNSTSATLGPGTLLVPVRETVEVDRSQALEDHELTHTLQYAKWGPLWFNIFPMLAMELPGILATDTELPEYSRFLDATVATGTADRWNVTINDTGGVAIAKDDVLQLVQGATRSKVTVSVITGNVFEVRAANSTPPSAGSASVRKKQSASVFDDFYAFFDLLTHGGLMNLVGGSTWGGIFWLIGKMVYGIGRAIGGTGDLYPATVLEGGGAVTLSNPTDVSKFDNGGSVIVRQGDNSVVRTMTRNATVMTFNVPVSFTGDLQIALYDRHEPGSAFDWYNYYPATVNPDNQFTITIAPVGDNSIDLSPEDRVLISYQNVVPFKTDVLTVNGTEVELLDAVVIRDNETSLRIAKVGDSDPLGNADSTAMVEMGMGWMKWVFDPYGQIEYAASPNDEWARWLLRVMRWLLGTQNFSLLPGGYLWWGRLIPLIVGPEHVTPIEQEASENSGNLYSPLGRLHGQRTADGFGRHRMLVGDVARYRYWPRDSTTSFVTRGMLDTPGVQYNDNFLRTLPNRSATGAAGGEPNQNVIVGPAADPGRSIAEVFTNRPLNDPRVVPNLPPPSPPLNPDPLGFGPSDLGNVPVQARTQCMLSTYVSFTRSGNHRVTTTNGIGSAQLARDAFDRERQTLFYDVDADDVEVRVAGQAVDLSNPGTSDVVTIIPFQSALTVVTPNGSRVYRVAITNPGGPPLRLDGSSSLVGVASSPDLVPVEVTRFYAVSGTSYGSGGLAMAGMHLSRNVHIPVRRFSVLVADTLPIRAAADPALSSIASVAIGDDAFLLIPAAVTMPPSVTSIAGNPPAPAAASPFTLAQAVNAETFLGATGAAYRIRFPTGTPTGQIIVSVTVGDGTTNTVLTSTFDLN